MTRPRTKSLPFQDWPEADRIAFAALFAAGGVLDDRGLLSHLRQFSRTRLARDYAHWLKWLSEAMPDALDEVPADRISADRLWRWSEARVHLAPTSQHMLVDGVLRIGTALAPDRDWTAECRVRDHLRRAAQRSHGQRKTGRIVSSQTLLQVALRHGEAEPEGGETAIRARARQRDAALIAFLALMPMRSRACSELALGTSVILDKNRILIALSGDMTKNGQPWEAPVPDVIAPLLKHYIDAVRPWLMNRHGQFHDRLWVGDRGQPYPAQYLSKHIAAITLRLVGVSIPAHFFRDAAATTLARSAPADARLIRPLLGHLDFATSERHYIQARQIEAGRDHAAVLEGLK